MGKPAPLSFKVTSTLAAQRIVYISAANTVAYPTSNQDLPIGITTDNVKDTTSSISVQTSGRAKLLFNDTVAAGGLVQSDSSGRGVPFTLADTTTALTLASAYVGILSGNAVAATAAVEEVLIMPGFDRE